MQATTDLSQFNNDWYKPGAGPFKKVLWYVINSVFINSVFPISKVKVMWLRIFGASIGKGVVIKPHVNIKYPWRLTIHNYVWIGEYVWIDNLADVEIKSNVCVSQGAMLLCGNHNYKTPHFDLVVGPIILEEGSWIGAKSIVCPSVVVGNHTVLTVGSVATRSLDAYSVYQGNPAVKIKAREIQSN